MSLSIAYEPGLLHETIKPPRRRAADDVKINAEFLADEVQSGLAEG